MASSTLDAPDTVRAEATVTDDHYDDCAACGERYWDDDLASHTRVEADGRRLCSPPCRAQVPESVPSPPAATAPRGWGLEPAPGTRYHWSARAIYRDGTVDLLHDRQGIEGTADPAERAALCRWLDTVGLPALRHACAERDAPSPRERRQIAVGGGGYTLRANPNASSGYLYLSCAPDGTMYSPAPRPRGRAKGPRALRRST